MGPLWRFLRLAGSVVELDEQEYRVRLLPKLVGILVRIVDSEHSRTHPQSRTVLHVVRRGARASGLSFEQLFDVLKRIENSK